MQEAVLCSLFLFYEKVFDLHIIPYSSDCFGILFLYRNVLTKKVDHFYAEPAFDGFIYLWYFQVRQKKYDQYKTRFLP
jgi:hypothetical protein